MPRLFYYAEYVVYAQQHLMQTLCMLLGKLRKIASLRAVKTFLTALRHFRSLPIILQAPRKNVIFKLTFENPAVFQTVPFYKRLGVFRSAYK